MGPKREPKLVKSDEGMTSFFLFGKLNRTYRKEFIAADGISRKVLYIYFFLSAAAFKIHNKSRAISKAKA